MAVDERLPFFGGFGKQRGGIFARLLEAADVLGERIAARLQLFGLRLNALAAVLKIVELSFRELKVAGLKTSNNFRKRLSQEIDVEHVVFEPFG